MVALRLRQRLHQRASAVRRRARDELCRDSIHNQRYTDARVILPPPRLFKYQSITAQTVANLRDRVLWCSAPIDFNDPFDCAAAVPSRVSASEWIAYHLSKGDPDAVAAAPMLADGADAVERMTAGFHDSTQDALQRQIRENLTTRGVVCLSATNTDILMWSHYANGHRGMCLEFRSSVDPIRRADQVQYQDSAPELNPLKLVRGEIGPEALADIMMLRKFSSWRYEQEWRVLAARGREPLHYPQEALVAIHLGIATSEDDARLVESAVTGTPTVIRKMRRALSGFAVAEDEG